MQFKGISGFGVYLSPLRMSRPAIAVAHSWAMPALRGLGKGDRAFCSWDEDPITLGVEALRNIHSQHQTMLRANSSRSPTTRARRSAT